MIRILAPAKVNLRLKVLGRRPDGYHDIESLVQKISLYDRIAISRAREPGIRIACSDPTIPCDAGNLAFRAARAIMDEAGVRDSGVFIQLEKQIPHGAGLGGGSSDAAAVLLGLNTLLGLSIPRSRIEELAAQIGADVPLFLHPSPAVISGRGETVRPAPVWVNAVFVVVFPGFPVSTKWAYSNFRLTKEPDKYTISALYRTESGQLPPNRWGDLLVNDLEAVVVSRHREIGRCKEGLVDLGARASLMSGSGSAVFGLFEDRQTAEQAAAGLSDEGGRVAIVALPLFS
ncbi:MAG: 4-(cytidine 5'-diphospho)-2-C-methyl-D-erythritol kinase [bacterium]|nr:MAG: 4-(cytidine 5'-diphospho)-2-C-methyl-D-erythritol kinase [bacterium]